MACAPELGYNPDHSNAGSTVSRLSLLAACLAVFSATLSAQDSTARAAGASSGAVAARIGATTGYGAWFGSIPNMDGAPGGILLDGTSTGSPAEKAGLRAGDRLLSIGGVRMEDLRSMVEVLRAAQPGDTVEVIYQRRNAMAKVKVVLGTRPAN